MSLLKLTIGTLLIAVTLRTGQCTVANFLADRGMVRMHNWIRVAGPEWLTIPSYTNQGLNSTNDGYFTLALAGPQFYAIDEMRRTEDAHMGADTRESPLYIDNQNLTFQLEIKNLTVRYKHIAYTDYNGLTNLSASVTSGGIKVNLTISITGKGSECVASAADALVLYKDEKEIVNRSYSEGYYPEVDSAINENFEDNIEQAIRVFMYAATVNIFDRYDICRDRRMSQSAFLTLKNLSMRELDLKKQ